jgi:hypothetical protein
MFDDPKWQGASSGASPVTPQALLADIDIAASPPSVIIDVIAITQLPPGQFTLGRMGPA